MKPPILSISCCFVLTVLSTAGLSHWWTIRQFVTAVHSSRPTAVITAPVSPAHTSAMPAAVAKSQSEPIARPSAPAAPTPNPDQKQFFEALITKMNGLQTQNRDLLDQLAETNRDLMKLEFRVDTHSESFRPLPVSEDRPYTSVEDTAGVLPPRAEPVAPHTQK
jgi:hypothetical protein